MRPVKPITIMACLLAGLFSFQIANKALYFHSHIDARGVTFTHAHPYDKQEEDQPAKSHHHTRAELYFLEILNIVFPVFFLVQVLISPPNHSRIFLHPQAGPALVFPTSHPGRSPPHGTFSQAA